MRSGFRVAEECSHKCSNIGFAELEEPFRGHVDASQLAVEGTQTRLDVEGRDRMMAYL